MTESIVVEIAGAQENSAFGGVLQAAIVPGFLARAVAIEQYQQD
jgi:hypothetical protein